MEARGGTLLVRTSVLHCTRADLAATLLHQELAEGDYACLVVRDTGVGMDQETLKRIFDPFFTTKFPGRGLGLAALLGIVRAHHGAVDVQSAPGEGTRFRIFVPVQPQATPSTALATTPAAN
jgi:signal transduction histidine kinase